MSRILSSLMLIHTHKREEKKSTTKRNENFQSIFLPLHSLRLFLLHIFFKFIVSTYQDITRTTNLLSSRMRQSNWWFMRLFFLIINSFLYFIYKNNKLFSSSSYLDLFLYELFKNIPLMIMINYVCVWVLFFQCIIKDDYQTKKKIIKQATTTNNLNNT